MMAAQGSGRLWEVSWLFLFFLNFSVCGSKNGTYMSVLCCVDTKIAKSFTDETI